MRRDLILYFITYFFLFSFLMRGFFLLDFALKMISISVGFVLLAVDLGIGIWNVPLILQWQCHFRYFGGSKEKLILPEALSEAFPEIYGC